jgi:signal transduction histidine kinase
MAVPEGRRSLPLLVIGNLALAAAYIISGKLGLQLAFLNISATPVWPPVGIALAALLLWGFRLWPGIALGAFITNLLTQGTVWTSLGIAAGNTLEPVLGAFLVARYAHGRFALRRLDDIFRLVLFAALLATTVSATFGVSSLALGGFVQSFWPVWLTWWLGDATGVIIVTPLLLAWFIGGRPRWPVWRFAEAALLLLVTVFLALVAFGGLWPLDSRPYPLSFITIPPLLWAAIRFGRRGVTTAILLLSGITIWGTLNGYGSFVRPSPNESLLLLQAFIGVMAVTVLALAAVIGEVRRAREEIRESHRALHRQARKTAAAHRTLQAAYARLKELDRLKGQFLIRTSHALKTPLTPVIIQAQMLLHGLIGRLSREQRKSITVMLRNMKVLDRRIRNIIELATIQARKLMLNPERSSIADTAAEVVKDLQPAARQRRISLAVRIPRQLPSVVYDRNLIHDVLLNLAENAIKFTPAGGKVSIEAASRADGVLVRVRDTGVGIPERDMEDLFKPFFQSAHTYGGKGTGLGLAIAKGVVELHGGRIWAESVHGKGSTFSFTLPFRPVRLRKASNRTAA